MYTLLQKTGKINKEAQEATGKALAKKKSMKLVSKAVQLVDYD